MAIPAPAALTDLVERFDRNRVAYRSGQYNEAQTRRELIDPLFELLGWDMTNRAGYAEAYKDVVHEASLRAGRVVEAPDYCFRIGGAPKFFLEAKKPSVNLKDDISPAYQLRRYAWSAKLPLSVLTDFEEFAVYDCRSKPDRSDGPAVGRTIYLTYSDYIRRWDEIAAIFNPEAIRKGSFDAYVESNKAKRGTAEVDDAFLADIEQWRELLARNIALRNPSLSQRDLNHAVQATIDRIIFLRICEDRGIEEYGRLLALQNGGQVYARLVDLFHGADLRYNSGIFHFRDERERPEPPDQLTLGLTIDDAPLKQILKTLYYPDSPYEFSVLPADILGQVYEQFLGKVIRLTEGHQARVEDKPEVKKAGGVYYTPTYIVDYIVRNTLGKMIEDKTPEQIAGSPIGGAQPRRGRGVAARVVARTGAPLRVLDPACGSGSFLIAAYQYLLDWHLRWYSEHAPEAWARRANPPIVQSQTTDPRALTPGWRLTTSERKRILLDHIYGVDIDAQAVEVTKLSLLLKVLEGENSQTLEPQLRLFQERALPDLSANIKCGNSLIGPDFYDNRQMSLLSDEERYRINVFDWVDEFPRVFQRGDAESAAETPSTAVAQRGAGREGQDGYAGGFDVVIGNPPYGATLHPLESPYLRDKFITAEYQLDSYPLFIEHALRLCRQRGYVGMIVPSAWVASQYNRQLRELVLRQSAIERVVVAPKRAFVEATVETLILVLRRGETSRADYVVERWDLPTHRHYQQSTDSILANAGHEYPVYVDARGIRLLAKLRVDGDRLSNIAEVVWGVKVYQKGKGRPKQTGSEVQSRRFHSNLKTRETHLPLVGGSEITRYFLRWQGTYVDYGPWLAEPRSRDWFVGSRMLIREVTNKGAIQATIVTEPLVFSNSVDGVRMLSNRPALEFLLGLLNSRLLSFVNASTSANAFKSAFPKVLLRDLESLPIPRLDHERPEGKARHDQMVQLVQQMLDLHKRLQEAQTAHDKAVLQRQIEATDRQIDRLVYELYELTDEEIRLVEEGGR